MAHRAATRSRVKSTVCSIASVALLGVLLYGCTITTASSGWVLTAAADPASRRPWTPPVVFVAAADADAAYSPPIRPDDIVVGAFLRFEIGLLDPQNCFGIDAALLEQNEKHGGIRGRRLRLEVPGPSWERSEQQRLDNFISRAHTYTAVIMSSVLWMRHVPRLVDTAHVPVFGPHVVANTVSGKSSRNEHIIQIEGSAQRSATQLLNYATRSPLHVSKVMVVFASHLGYGQAVNALRIHVAALGIAPLIEVSIFNGNISGIRAKMNAALDNEWSNSSDTLPSAVRLPQAVIFLITKNNTALLINDLYHDPRVDRDVMSFFGPHTGTSHKWVNASGSSEPFRNFYHTIPYPFYNDTRYLVVQQYQQAMLRAFEVFNDTNYRNMSLPYLRGSFGDQSLGGYVAARVAIEAMRRVLFNESVTAANVMAAVYRTRLFKVADLDFGPFTNGCTGEQAPGFMACWCNDGQRQIFTTRVNGTTGVPQNVDNDPTVNDAIVSMPPSSCVAESNGEIASTFRKLEYLVLPGTDQLLQEAHRKVVLAARTRTSMYRARNLFRPVELFPLQVDSASLSRCALYHRYSVRGFVGDVPDESNKDDASCTVPPLLSFGPWRGAAWPVSDPPVQAFAVWHRTRAVIPLYPVLSDVIDAAVDFAAARSAISAVHVVVDTQAALDAVTRSMNARGEAAPASSTLVPLDTSASTDRVALIAALLSHLRSITSGVVIVASQQRDVIRAIHNEEAAASSSSANRDGGRVVVFATSEFVLEEGLDHSAAAMNLTHVLYVSGLRSYGAHQNATSAYGAFQAELMTAFGDPAASTAAQFVYRLGRLATTTAALEPLSAEECPASAVASGVRSFQSSCQCSKGLNTFFIRPLRDWATNPTKDAAHSMTHQGCGVQYPPGSHAPGLSTAVIVALAVCGVALLVALGFAVVVAVTWKRDPASKRVQNAPTDTGLPFAMIFTDIQASTVLWAYAPELMGAALDVHNDVIRRLIAAHNGYEVKTIGDSFMIAFKDAERAVKFALATQSALFECAWGTDEFDEAYAEETNGFEDTAPPAVPGSVWSGLRVRVSAHHGKGDIKYDVTARSYDYYGTVVNTAARVEGVAHGGQVLLTHDCFAAASGSTGDAAPSGHFRSPDEEPNNGQHENPAMASSAVFADVSVTVLGPQPLRGLDTEVVLYQVLPRTFAPRRFPPLRLDIERVVHEDEDSVSDAGATNSCHDEGARRPAALNAVAERFARRLRLNTDPCVLAFGYRLIQTMMSTMPEKRRGQRALDLASKWRVPNHLPHWAEVRAAALLHTDCDCTPDASSRRSFRGVPPEPDDVAAARILFMIARVVSALEALPDTTRPPLTGSRGGAGAANEHTAGTFENAAHDEHSLSGLRMRPAGHSFSIEGESHEPSPLMVPTV